MTSLASHPVLLLMGPTASGKSALAMELAEILDTEIISVDSALVYRGMDIGTAKPSKRDRHEVVHHLIDIVEPYENFSTGQFRDASTVLIDELISRGKIPLLVGGTMLYFSSLTQGLAQLPPADDVIRQRLELEMSLFGKEFMHDKLRTIDPVSANRIHQNDPQRIQRALEVFEITGKPLSFFFIKKDDTRSRYDFKSFVISPQDRKVLHERISIRFKQMLESGFVDEVSRLKSRGDLNPSMPSMRCVGYRQVWNYLEGEISETEMIDTGIAATRQLAKRQLTWLRKEKDISWLDPSIQDCKNYILKSIKS